MERETFCLLLHCRQQEVKLLIAERKVLLEGVRVDVQLPVEVLLPENERTAIFRTRTKRSPQRKPHPALSLSSRRPATSLSLSTGFSPIGHIKMLSQHFDAQIIDAARNH